ncbi:unnamed protein product, partial [Durusdinium trenchii]
SSWARVLIGAICELIGGEAGNMACTARWNEPGQARSRASPQRRASEERELVWAPWPTLKNERPTGAKGEPKATQPPKTARAELRRTQPSLSLFSRPGSPGRISPATARTTRLSSRPSSPTPKQSMPFATLLPQRGRTEAVKMRASSTTGNIKVPVLRGLDAEAVSGPSQKRSRPGDAPEPSLTPRGTCPARFTTLAEARWAFKTRVGAVEQACMRVVVERSFRLTVISSSSAERERPIPAWHRAQPGRSQGSDGPDTTYDGACMGFASAVGALQHACCKLGGMEVQLSR